MKAIDRNKYYKKFAQVSVNNRIISNTSKCNSCKDKLQKFTVFIGEEQRLSTLYCCCCNDCLPIVVNEAIKEGISDAENQIKRAEERTYKEAEQYLRKEKLKQISVVVKNATT